MSLATAKLDDVNHVAAAAPTTVDKNTVAEAAEGINQEKELGLLQSLKLYRKACLWSIFLSTCIVMEGFDLTLINNLYAYGPFKEKFGELQPDGSYELTAAWQSGLSNGALCGQIMGLFANGIARWGFDSILQTSAALRADAKLNSLVPHIMEPVIQIDSDNLFVTFNYSARPPDVDGMSVLVNDVERARAFSDSEGDAILDTFEWGRPVDSGLNEYFRWAYIRGQRTLDYSKPGTLFANGTWSFATP